MYLGVLAGAVVVAGVIVPATEFVEQTGSPVPYLPDFSVRVRTALVRDTEYLSSEPRAVARSVATAVGVCVSPTVTSSPATVNFSPVTTVPAIVTV